MRITVAVRDKVGKDFEIQEIKRIKTESKLDMERIAKACEQVVRETIMRKSEQPTGHLASLMNAEPIPGGWGVGDIPTLDTQAPYWNHCLAKDTEVYIEENDQIAPCKLGDLFKKWNCNKFIKILTPTGLKNIKNIWKVNVDSYYDFNISKWHSVKMSKNHKLIYKLKNGYFEKTAESFGSSFSCYSTLFTTLKSINNYKIKSTICIDNRNIELDYLFGWILGMILAEGIISCFGYRITVPQKNIDKIASYFTEYCRRFNYLPIIEKKYDNNCDRITINNKKIYNLIKKFISGKSYNKQFEKLFLNTPIEYRQGILDGYNLGDGRQSCINNYEIRTSSEKLRNQLLVIGSSLGYDCSIWKDDTFCGKNSFKRNYPTKGGNILNHCRKYNVKNNICKKIGKDRKSLSKNRDSKGKILPQKYLYTNFCYFPKSIVDINKIDNKQEFIDITVDGGLFLINGGIVSHNCDKGSEGIGANWDHYLPTGYWQNGRWVEDPTGFCGVKPEAPIPAMNYIADTLAQMELIIPKILKRKS